MALLLALLCQSDPRDEIRKAMTDAASLPSAEWEQLQKKPRSLEEMSARGKCTLTFAVLSLPLHPDIELDLIPEAEIRPRDVQASIAKTVVSCLQPGYIKDLTCAVDKDEARGAVTAEIPKFGKLTAEYVARRQVLWQLVEFRLPRAGMVCALDGDQWRLKWETPRARELSLVWSFGAMTLFGRKVYDWNEDKWETLEKIFADRESMADSSVVLSGSGPGWTWATVRRVMSRGRNVKTFRLRGEQSFDVKLAPADQAPVLHLCASRAHAASHLGDATAHVRELAKLAQTENFGDEMALWIGDDPSKAVVLRHPMSDDKTIAADRKAIVELLKPRRDAPAVALRPDPQVFCEHLLRVASIARNLGIREIRFAE
jgi:hypothetical protein